MGVQRARTKTQNIQNESACTEGKGAQQSSLKAITKIELYTLRLAVLPAEDTCGCVGFILVTIEVMGREESYNYFISLFLLAGWRGACGN